MLIVSFLPEHAKAWLFMYQKEIYLMKPASQNIMIKRMNI